MTLALPLRFTPVYQTVVWGGRRMAEWRDDLPDGPVGESWDLADQDRGMSVVAEGALKGRTLRQLTADFGPRLVGEGFAGGDFPLLIKLIDANDRLSVQVHPDDALAQELGLGKRGKTECWFMLGDGGELFVGTVPGCTREGFSAAREHGTLAAMLQRFEARDGDFFMLDARTVHALGRGCLLYEVQQSCDVTFRVDDWGRVGLDGKPRPLHIQESLATIAFDRRFDGPTTARTFAHPQGGSCRRLVDGAYFAVEERRAGHTGGGGNGICSIVTCLGGAGALATAAGSLPILAMQTLLVPADAGAWTATADAGSALRLLVSQPTL